jgi:NitT/TauT family transport system permease protein
VLLLGPSTGAEIAAVIAVVFFLGFFNAFEGGCRIPRPILENALLLGAGPLEVMRFIRLPQVVTWTFATIPNAIAFGLVTAVTTELLAGIQGMGALLLTSTSNVEASLTFTVIVYLSVTGLLLYSGAVLLRRSVIRWEV